MQNQIAPDLFNDFRADISCDGHEIQRAVFARKIGGRKMICVGRTVGQKQVQPLLFSTPVSTLLISGETNCDVH
jgi:hypothetical protein